MERRYKLMSTVGVRNLAGFNKKVKDAIDAGQPMMDPLFKPNPELGEAPRPLEPLPYIVVFIDEFADMFLLLRANELGLGASQVTLLWASFSAVAAFASTPFSALSDRIGRKRLILAGWAGYAVLYVLLGVVTISPAWLWVLFPAYGLVTAMIEGSERALVADMVPAQSAGTAFGWYYLVTGLLLLPASAVFGTLWEKGSPMWAFGLSAAFAVAASLVLVTGRKDA